MGQYHILVNLDKREFVNPHMLGDGLKLLEQFGSSGGVASALIALLAVSNGRGGGDFGDDDGNEVIGSWGGNRIAIVGDYAEDEDLSPVHRASLIYGMCRSQEDWADADMDAERKWWEEPGERWTGRKVDGEYVNEETPSKAEQYGMTFDEYVAESRRWRDISMDVRPLIVRYLNIRFFGDGWQRRIEMCWEHPDKIRGHVDHTNTGDPFIVTRPPRISDSEIDLNLRFGIPPEVLGISGEEAALRNGGWRR